MQQRVPIKKYKEHAPALVDKQKMEIANPKVNYQIRRNKDGFALVRRFTVNEISRLENLDAKKRTGPSKRKRNRQIDAAFLSEVRGTPRT